MICSNCRRNVDEIHRGSVEGTDLVQLCDDCYDELVGESDWKRLTFGEESPSVGPVDGEEEENVDE